MFSIFIHNLKQLLISIDQFLNVLFCMVLLPRQKSWGDETFSARLHRLKDTHSGWSILRHLVDALFWCFGDKNHCENSYKSEQQGKQLPPELRR